jgi:hypothetical protein
MRILLFLAAASVAFAQSSAADRVVTTPPAAKDGVERFLDLVGPTPAAEAPHTEKFSEFVAWTVGPVPLLGEAAGAGISQWTNSPEEWGQGWGAFGKRYASNLAYNGIRQVINYAGSTALREDTRYFASRRSGFGPRAKHALVSTFLARRMDGSYRFGVSSTAGVIGAATISSYWGPDSWKGPGNVAANAGLSFASTAAFNVVREFLPDLFGRRRN